MAMEHQKTLEWWEHQKHEEGEELARIVKAGAPPETECEVQRMLCHALKCCPPHAEAAAILAACECKRVHEVEDDDYVRVPRGHYVRVEEPRFVPERPRRDDDDDRPRRRGREDDIREAIERGYTVTLTPPAAPAA